MTDLVRQSEENGNRLRSVETGMGQLKTDQDQRISRARAANSAAAAAPAARPKRGRCDPPPPSRKPRSRPAPPKTRRRRRAEAAPSERQRRTAAAAIRARMLIRQGFHQWEAGQYDQAISTLKAFTAAYPKHRRVSYANNLIGRALLDKGDAARRGRRPCSPITAPIPAASVRRTASIISARR